MNTFINKITKATFVKEVGTVMIGNSIARGIAFLSTIFLVRILDPGEFANFSIFFTIAVLSSQFFSGFDNAFVRFFAKEKKPSSIKAFLFIKVLSIVIIFIIGLSAINLISSYLKVEEYKLFIIIAFLASSGISFLALSLSFWQAKEKFISYSGFLTAPRLLFFFLIIIFWYLYNSKKFKIYFLLYMLSFLFIAFSSVFSLIKSHFIKDEKGEFQEEIKKIFHFGKWLFLSTILYSFYQRSDLLILSHFVDKNSVGIYAIAVRLASLIGVIGSSITIISNPKASKLESFEEIKLYLAKSFKTLLLLLTPISIIILFRNPIIKLFFGSQYQAANSPFLILAIAYILIMSYTPLLYLFYTLNKPHLVFVQATICAIALPCFCYMLIPTLSLIGAALSVLLTYGLGAIMTLILSLFQWKQINFENKEGNNAIYTQTTTMPD